MRSYLSVSAYLCLSSLFSACAILPAAESNILQCGESKDTPYSIPTNRGPFPINVQFKMACHADKKGVEVSIKNHPWGGVGKTMPISVGPEAPDYEYIPCAGNKEADAILKIKWDDFESYEHFANKGRDIEDIHHVGIDMRFREDYMLRHYVLNSAKNMCDGLPEATHP